MSCVDSIGAEGDFGLTGDVTVSAGEGIVLTQVGQDIEIAVDAFGAASYQALGAPAGTSGGTSVAPNASANQKGSWVELGTSSIDADGFYVSFSPGTPSRDYLLDIGTGAALSEVALISNMLLSTGSNATGFGEAISFFVPLAIASGTRVAARVQCSGASAAAVSGYVTLAQGEAYALQSCTVATTYGANTADSGGTSVDPGGTINTDGSYSQLSASVSDINSMLIFLGNQANADRATASWRVDLGTGVALSEVVVVPSVFARAVVEHDVARPQANARAQAITSGTRLAARARCSINDATDRLIDVVVIGFS